MFAPMQWKGAHLWWASIVMQCFLLVIWEFSYSNTFATYVYSFIIAFKAFQVRTERMARTRLIKRARSMARVGRMTKATEARLPNRQPPCFPGHHWCGDLTTEYVEEYVGLSPCPLIPRPRRCPSGLADVDGSGPGKTDEGAPDGVATSGGDRDNRATRYNGCHRLQGEDEPPLIRR